MTILRTIKQHSLLNILCFYIFMYVMVQGAIVTEQNGPNKGSQARPFFMPFYIYVPDWIWLRKLKPFPLEDVTFTV